MGRDHDPAQLSGARLDRARDEHARTFAPRGARIAFLSLLVLATAGTLASAQDRGPIEGGETYRRPLSNDPASLDPARIRDVHSLAVTQQIFDGLVQFDHKLTITPALAQHWKASRDGLTWTFTLRKGVKFHHGREVTADDVIYSLTRIVDPRTKSGAADLLMTLRGAQDFREGKARQISGLAALDPCTIQVSLTEATVPLVALLAVGHAKVLPRELVEQLGEGFGAQPVGTGPFRFVRWDRGQEIVLAANSDYFEVRPPSPASSIGLRRRPGGSHVPGIRERRPRGFPGTLEELPPGRGEPEASLRPTADVQQSTLRVQHHDQAAG